MLRLATKILVILLFHILLKKNLRFRELEEQDYTNILDEKQKKTDAKEIGEIEYPEILSWNFYFELPLKHCSSQNRVEEHIPYLPSPIWSTLVNHLWLLLECLMSWIFNFIILINLNLNLHYVAHGSCLLNHAAV